MQITGGVGQYGRARTSAGGSKIDYEEESLESGTGYLIIGAQLRLVSPLQPSISSISFLNRCYIGQGTLEGGTRAVASGRYTFGTWP